MAPVPDEDGIGVAEAIESLRHELELARSAGQGHDLQFGVDNVTLTLEVVASGKREASGKVRWWVVEADASGERSHEATQTLVLTLKPTVSGADGVRQPLDVSAVDPE